MCGLNLMIIPDEIEELIKIYERRGTYSLFFIALKPRVE